MVEHRVLGDCRAAFSRAPHLGQWQRPSVQARGAAASPACGVGSLLRISCPRSVELMSLDCIILDCSILTYGHAGRLDGITDHYHYHPTSAQFSYIICRSRPHYPLSLCPQGTVTWIGHIPTGRDCGG